MDTPICRSHVCIILMLLAALGCAAGRADRQAGVADGARRPPPEAAALWRHVQEIDPYQSWSSLQPPGMELYPAMRRGVVPARNPHGAYLRLLGNAIALQAAEQAAGRPMWPGAILVKENFARDKTTLNSVSIMYKVEGYHPEAGDWFWGMYAPDGRVLAAGKVQSCIECHRSQYRHDWRFTGAMPRH
jgi:hypothetical protein